MRSLAILAACVALGCATAAAAPLPPEGPADASVDLGTPAGIQLVQGAWRYSDARVVEVDFRSPGPDRKPSGPPNRTYEILPHAGAADFDDSTWDVLDPTTLDARRATGKVCFNWYRVRITIPERIGAFDAAGATVFFDTIVDDYAEIWVDGQLRRDLGQSGGTVVGGFNVPNRLLVGRNVQPGQRIQIAVFGINGPISAAPENFIWIRHARLDFYAWPKALRPEAMPVSVLRADPALDEIVPACAQIEKLATGFQFTEGPVWLPEGRLFFSDPNANRIYEWTPSGNVSVFRDQSGYAGADIGEYTQPGSNGLTLARDGRLVFCQHGNRRVVRLEPDGRLTVLADRYQGKRLNSPNDLVLRSDGTLYFSDPPFGLPQFHADPRRELDTTGVFRLSPRGELALVSADLTGPNGLAFSPDERYLYVTDWDPAKKVVMRYEVAANGDLAGGSVFFDMGAAPQEEALDGIKVDERGNLYVSGPGGLWILSAAGRHLGTIQPPELPANFAFGGEDGRTLYMTARTGLYRMRLLVPGIRPQPAKTSLAATAKR